MTRANYTRRLKNRILPKCHKKWVEVITRSRQRHRGWLMRYGQPDEFSDHTITLYDRFNTPNILKTESVSHLYQTDSGKPRKNNPPQIAESDLKRYVSKSV